MGSNPATPTNSSKTASSVVTGPDLPSRAIFFTVGPRGSRNAMPKAYGLEEMVPIRPRSFPWNSRTPGRSAGAACPAGVDPGAERETEGRPALQTDQTPAGRCGNVIVAYGYFEVLL